jgi:DNA-binding MarR family transcriptional regulator
MEHKASTASTDQFGRLLKRAQHKLHLVMTKHLQPYGITLSQYATLTVIQNMSPINGATLARETFVTPQTMHTLLMSLARKKLVERTLKVGNAKSLDIHLTAKGARVLAEATHIIDGVTEQSEVIFSEADIALMKQNLALYEKKLDDL